MPKDKKIYNLDLFTGEETGVLPASVSEGYKKKKENKIIKLQEEIVQLKEKVKEYTELGYSHSKQLYEKSIKTKEKGLKKLLNM